MKLCLQRHGEAEYNSPTGKDFGRQLSLYGKRQIGEVKRFLMEKETTTEFDVYCSNATRTKETLQILSSGIQINKNNYFDELYHADYPFLIDFLKAIDPAEETVLLVGHNNGISDLASYLLDKKIGLPTGGILIIDFTVINDWADLGRGTGEEIERFYPIIEE